MRKLQHPPIVEAVLDIECDLPPGRPFAEIESMARERFRDQYPKRRSQTLHQIQFELRPDSASKQDVRLGVQAFQFLHEDEKQLVQVRLQGFSFNRLAPYTTLDDYLPEIQRTWGLYSDLASPIQVRTIRMRYINRILLPRLPKIDLDEYFAVAPRMPEEKSLTMTGFLKQFSAIEDATRNQVNFVLTSQPPELEKFPFILDISVTSPARGEPKDWQWILGQIQSLRGLKNRMFEKAVTEKCLTLFQQQ
ncbi:MAG TPA: TIGR04255 family protein [Planctomycetota bacterium]